MTSSQHQVSDTGQLAQALVRRESVTPEDAGCQALLADRLSALGFQVESIVAGDVTNLWARRGNAAPLFVFAGHTDVVPTGPAADWQKPPFGGDIENGMLHGRGAADMKGSIASFITACERFIGRIPGHTGSIALLITSDEEGPAVHGTRAVLEMLAGRGEQIDLCVVGEPTSSERLGDIIKVGRRGSLGARLRVNGVQGHIAYPHLADNPVHRLLPALDEIIKVEWDQGNSNFQPTSLQVSNINAGTGATNVIPGTTDVLFNIRFCPETTEQDLRSRIEQILDRHGLNYAIDWNLSGQPFETGRGTLIEAVEASIESVTGESPQSSTSGGTSDGRFIAPTGAQVVELGPINATIHKVDEQVSVADLDQLSLCYENILERLLSP